MDRDARLAHGQWLREQRERRGLSARQLAAAIDVAPQSVYNWEIGKAGVDDERAEQLATVLEMDVLEVRRNLGLWIPDQSGGDTSGYAASIQEDLKDIAVKMDEIQAAMKRISEYTESQQQTGKSQQDNDVTKRRRGA